MDRPGHVDTGNCSEKLGSSDEPRSLVQQDRVDLVASIRLTPAGSESKGSNDGRSGLGT